VITRVCLLVGWFVRYACCAFSESTSPIFLTSGADVQHLCRISLSIFKRSRSKFRIQDLCIFGPTSLRTLFLGRPEQPLRTGLCFTAVPSTDRPETLPHGRNLAAIYNPTPKIRGALPPKKIGGQKHAKFRSILDHFRL